MRKTMILSILVLMMALLLAACGGGEEDAPIDEFAIGDVANGEKLFKQTVIGPNSAPGCITCHSLEPDQVIVGPAQHDVAVRAATRVDGLSAEDYIRQSIVEPNAYLVEGYAEGIMYQTYGDDLSDSEINDIVAYMLTLDG
jgi:cytochrome c